MSQILSEWLNQEVGLSTCIKPTEIDDLFRSGFLFGELLAKYGLQSDFDSFVSSRSTDSWVTNFIKIEPTFRRLGIPFNVQIVTDLMHGKPGTAAELLYQLRISLPKAKTTEKGISQSNYENDVLSYPSTPKNQAPRSALGYSVPISSKFLHDQKEHEFFSYNLKSKTKRIDHELEAIAQRYRHFREQQESQKLMIIEEKKKKLLQEKLHRLEQIREEERSKKKLSRSKFSDMKLPKTYVEVIRIEQEKMKLSKAKKKAEMAKRSAFESYKSEVERFENAMNPEKQFNSTVVEAPVVPIVEEKTVEEPKKNEKKKEEAKEVEEELTEAELEQKRAQEKHILMSLHDVQEERLKEEEENQLFLKLIRESKEERRIASEIQLVRYEKDIITRNRLFREQQFKDQREKEWEESLAREQVAGASTREQSKMENEFYVEKHRELLHARLQRKRLENEKFCKSVAEQIIELSLKVADMRLIMDGFVPEEFIVRQKAVFVKGYPLEQRYVIDAENDRIELSESNNEEKGKQEEGNPESEGMSKMVDKKSVLYKGVQLQDNISLDSYLNLKNDWKFDDKDIQIANEPLATIVDKILSSTQVKKEPWKPKFPSLPLKLSVIGKQFSGKSTVCHFLSTEYNLKVIQCDTVVQEFLNETIPPEDTERLNLQTCISETLSKGSPLDDLNLVKIIIEAVKNINSDGKNYYGWILDDFPRTKEQAIILDKELAGHEESKPIKPGNLKRNSIRPDSTKRKSLIAQSSATELDQIQPKVESGSLDMVIMLDVENAAAFQRAAGRRLDPLTGKIYHLEIDPPPYDKPGLIERLVSVDENTEQLHLQIMSFQNNEEELKEWYKKFDNFRIFDSSFEQKYFLQNIKEQIKTLEEKKAANARPQSSKLVPQLELTNEAVVENNNFLKVLSDQWASMENTYTITLKYVFRNMRRGEEQGFRTMFFIKQGFYQFLIRPDEKQALVNQFQNKYNEFDDDIRTDPDFKAEMHQRTHELQEKLWELTEKRKAENDQERANINNERVLEDRLIMISNYYIAILQLEIHRHLSTRQILMDYYYDLDGKSVKKIEGDMVQLNFLSLVGKDNDQLKKPPSPKMAKKTTGKKDNDLVNDNNPITIAVSQAYNGCITALSVNEVDENNIMTSVTELNPERAKEVSEIILQDEKLTRKRLEAVKERGHKHLQMIHKSIQKLVEGLEAKSNERFTNEMNAIRDIIQFIREAIELEIKLFHEINILGDKFFVNLNTINVEKESPMEEDLTIEPQIPDQFTATQIINLAKLLKRVTTSLFISVKDFEDLISRIASSANGLEMLPDFIAQMDYSTFVSNIQTMDNLNTGFIYWPKFILMQMRLIPSIEELLTMKEAFEKIDSGLTGSIALNDFNAVTLWFESVDRPYKKNQKLRQVLTGNLIQECFTEGADNSLFNYRVLLRVLCIDENAKSGVQRALKVLSHDSKVDMQLLRDVYQNVHYPIVLSHRAALIKAMLYSDEKLLPLLSNESVLVEDFLPLLDQQWLCCSFYGYNHEWDRQ